MINLSEALNKKSFLDELKDQFYDGKLSEKETILLIIEYLSDNEKREKQRAFSINCD